MKKLLFALVLSIIILPGFGQSMNDIIEIERSVLKVEKKAAVAENMNLTEAEAGVFWPVYEEFSNELYELQTERIKIIKEYAENYQKMDDIRATDLMNRSLKHKQAKVKLELKYFKRFNKVLAPSKVARFFQIHNKINALIAAELAIEIPLVESK